MTVYADNDRHSVSVFAALKDADRAKTDGAMLRSAKLRNDLNALDKQVREHLQRIEDSRSECAKAGIVMEYSLSAPLAAAQHAWRTEEPQQNRLAITEIAEAPLMPLEDELGG